MKFKSSENGFAALVVVLAVAGAWICGSMLLERDGGWQVADAASGLIGGDGGCSWEPAGTLSCSEVVGSRWGSFDVYLGGKRFLVPTSFLGLAYFTCVALWFGLITPPALWGKWITRATALGIAAGAVVSVLFLLLMGTQLRSWCSGCVYVHVINGAIILASIPTMRRRGRPHGSGTPLVSWAELPQIRQLRRRAVGGTIAVGAAMTTLLWMYYDAGAHARREWRDARRAANVIQTLKDDAHLMMAWFEHQPRVADGLVLQQAGFNPSNIGPRVDVFTSLNDPRANCFEARMARLANTTLGGWTVARHMLPARRTRAREIEPTLTSRSIEDVTAYHAAASQGGGYGAAMIRKALQRRTGIGGGGAGEATDYRLLAESVELDAERLARDMHSMSLRARVEGDVALARAMQAEDTPAVFVDGKRVPALCVISELFWTTLADKFARENDCERDDQEQTTDNS